MDTDINTNTDTGADVNNVVAGSGGESGADNASVCSTVTVDSTVSKASKISAPPANKHAMVVGTDTSILEDQEIFQSNLDSCVSDNASKLSMTMLNVCGSLGSRIDLETLFNHCITHGCPGYTFTYSGSKKPRSAARSNTAVSFYNCLSVMFTLTEQIVSPTEQVAVVTPVAPDAAVEGATAGATPPAPKPVEVVSRLAVKIFSNGSLQVPGCRTISSVHKAMKIVHDLVLSLHKEIESVDASRKVIQDVTKYKLGTPRVAMINGTFSFGKRIDQEELKNVLNTHERYDGKDESRHWRLANFQHGKSTTVVMKYFTEKGRERVKGYYGLPSSKSGPRKTLPLIIDDQVTVLLFGSGKGSISGAKSTDGMLSAYRAITSVIEKYWEEVVIDA